MALMERVYSRRWHLLSPRPTPFSSLSPFKRFSSWSTVPQTSSSGCSAVFSPFSLFGKPADKCLSKVVPTGGWSVEKCVWGPKCFQIHSLRKLWNTKVYIKVCGKAPLIRVNWKAEYFCFGQLVGEERAFSVKALSWAMKTSLLVERLQKQAEKYGL